MPAKRLSLSVVALTVALGFARPVAAQIIKAEYNASITMNLNPPVTPLAAITSFLSAQAAQATGAQTYDVNYSIPVFQNGNSTLNANFTLSVPSNLQAAGINFINNGGVVNLPTPTVSTSIDVRQELLRVTGSAALYSFGIGSLSVSQTISGQYCFVDRVHIYSPVATALALPVRLQASASTAESFGTPALTFGRVEASFSGTVNQQALAGSSMAVESSSVFPVTGDINNVERVRFNLAQGHNYFDVSIIGNFLVHADATPAGLAGLISGASSADIQFPELAIAQFEMYDISQPTLLPGITITSDTYGISYLPTPVPEPSATVLTAVMVAGILVRWKTRITGST